MLQDLVVLDQAVDSFNVVIVECDHEMSNVPVTDPDTNLM